MKLQSIQALRGFAAFAVAMTHLVSFERDGMKENGLMEQSLAGGLWQNGYAGVDLFFIISGFIMVYVTAGRERGATSAADFLLARVARIYPLWWLFMAAMACVFLIVHGTPYHPEEFGKTDSGAAIYILKSTLLIPQEGLPILGVGWTLIHEMYFYLVFALFLFAPQRWLPWLLVVWAGLTIGSYWAGFTSTAADSLLYVATYPMTTEFIMGAFAGLAYLRFPPRFALSISVVSAAAFLLAMIYFQNSDAAERGIWATLKWGRVICFGMPSAFLVYGLAALEKTRNVQFPKWVVGLGNISFALYLSHTLTYTAVKRAFKEVGKASENAGLPKVIVDSFTLGAPGVVDNLLFAIMCLGSAIILAMLSYKLFEQSSLGWLTKLRRAHIRPIKYGTPP